MTATNRILKIGLVMATAGCGVGSESAGTVTDSAGVRIVRNAEHRAWSEAERWTMAIDLRIGMAQGDVNYQFGHVADIAVDRDGRLYVLDQTASQIKVFDSEGRYATAFGRRGSGPGELSEHAETILLAGDRTLYVFDPAQQRMNMYDIRGSSLGSFPMPFTQGIPLRWEMSSSNEIVHQLRPLNRLDAAPDPLDAIVVRNADGTLGDTLLRVPSGNTFSLQRGRPGFYFFAAEPIWALAGGRTLYMGINDTYRIGRYVSNSLEQVVTMPFDPVPVTDGDRAMIADAIIGAWEEEGVPPAALEQLQENMTFADFYPAYAQILSGPHGTLWVQPIEIPEAVTARAGESYDPIEAFGSDDWDVFAPDGRYLGIVTMPSRFQPMQFVDHMLYGVQRDELDVQYVLRARIVDPDNSTP